MSEHHEAHAKARAFFDDIWSRGDIWQLETSEFEQAKYRCQLDLLGPGPHGRALEIGCASGCFSRLLASQGDQVVALDVSPLAIQRARELAARAGDSTVDFRVANVMEFDPAPDGPWDLVVMSETIYYLGWLYPFWDVGWMAKQLFEATAPGGRLLMANTRVAIENQDYLLQPWIIDTYRDLFTNVGYRAQVEELFRGEKEGCTLEALVTVFRRPS
jgi:2-polyprenyl-3-methyl-5-hydroxy-6-metoxy-1,4-benzoquinol methylase